MRITAEQKLELAAAYSISPAMLKAFLDVESAGSGFFTDWNGRQRIKIQFEPHWFRKYEETWINNGVRPQREEWAAFNQAAVISLESAMLSTSWGMGQVMGFNYRMCGFRRVGDMVDAFKRSEYEQVKGMLEYCEHKQGLMQAIRHRDFRQIAYLYNGSQYEKYGYHTKIENAYNRYA